MFRKGTNEDIPSAFRRMRRLTFLQTFLLWVAAVGAMAVWMFIYHYLGGKSGWVYMAGAGVILLFTFLYSPKIEKQVVCPACGVSLADIEGWNVFIKKCPHCGASYEHHT